MFDLLLFNLRARGVAVGLSEWLAFLDGLDRGLVGDLDGLYRFGRALLVHHEGHYDAWDVAFRATFEGVELEPELSEQLQRWLEEARDLVGPRPGGEEGIDLDPEALREAFRERLREQAERHDGGSRWIGTGGRSPFGQGGRAAGGIRVGRGGGRSAIAVAGERRWRDYRRDRRLELRDFQVALRALRSLAREGPPELDLDATVRRTADNAGEVELVERPGRRNRVHLVLLLDTGGSMDPHARLVERLFTAASELEGFRSFQAWSFHNAPYGWLYRSYASRERRPIPELLREWTPAHRVLWVGDASMAPYELFHPGGGFWASRWDDGEAGAMSGLDWLRLVRRRCPASAWLNPDPERYWQHPTVRAIAAVYPMFPLTLDGLRSAVRVLRGQPGR